ncbi:MAG: prepilin-type N-terminal cleavage/methylation domain-containing protein [Candidatus Omnitrophica bacterium]|nr:prepilin-type N-terminal cleavage/methylation domain-containing protein [bacterium]MBK7496480.1 prepilin-type N-terminal cleavage/methylation domain-containing protein [Candidatus Omnitrophota bacterium]MCE7907804.1 prepilin-type N-terminal cleavage/methylation domain-containing protein [Candidatus Omnitrophica bacterium COP1]MBW7940772.1 prepilin-type N-terminal cleavage/methylation domain-containing protein [Candidatus Omnitrophota bacterium]MCC6733549.1 prepilin-type N-terminal cleavage/m
MKSSQSAKAFTLIELLIVIAIILILIAFVA